MKEYKTTAEDKWAAKRYCDTRGTSFGPSKFLWSNPDLTMYQPRRPWHARSVPATITRFLMAELKYPLAHMIPARCLKNIEKVSFNIASEASYVYILSGHKLNKNTKMVHFDEFLKIWSLQSNSVTRQVSFNRTKIGGKCQNAKSSNNVYLRVCRKSRQ